MNDYVNYNFTSWGLCRGLAILNNDTAIDNQFYFIKFKIILQWNVPLLCTFFTSFQTVLNWLK